MPRWTTTGVSGSPACSLHAASSMSSTGMPTTVDERAAARAAAPARLFGRSAGQSSRRVPGTLRDEHAAVAVEDRAARRVEPQRAHAVVVRLREVLVAGEHLQRPQPQEQHREERERDEAEDRDAQRELRRQPVRLLDARVAGQEAAGTRGGCG